MMTALNFFEGTSTRKESGATYVSVSSRGPCAGDSEAICKTKLRSDAKFFASLRNRWASSARAPVGTATMASKQETIVRKLVAFTGFLGWSA
jgi:hypothetical protein